MLLDDIAGSTIRPVMKKRMFRAPYLRFRDYLGCYQAAFEVGVVLGYGFSDRLSILLKLIVRPAGQEETMAAITRCGKQLLEENKEPRTLLDLALLPEQRRFEMIWQTSNIGRTQLDFIKSHYKIPVDTAHIAIGSAAAKGIGLGSGYPQLVERLWAVEHENPPTDSESEIWQQIGLSPSKISLRARQEEVHAMVAGFASTNFPELVPQLRLKSQILLYLGPHPRDDGR
jgi:hypothetical protein